MSILLVCHSIGDTEIILDTANSLISKTKDSIYILTVGNAASNKVKSDRILKSQNVRHINITDILDSHDAKSIENAPLTQEQLNKVQAYFSEYNIERALIGTPSQMNAGASLQIAESLADKIEQGIIYNDYLYLEEKHIFWDTLKKKQKWQAKFNWCLPTHESKKVANGINNEVKTHVVGHRAIDGVTSSAPTDEKHAEKISMTRKNLQVEEKQSLLFISGTKNTEDDQLLLRELLSCINQDSQVEIRLGLHPGHSDLNAYVASMVSVINEFKNTAAGKVKFIITEAIVQKINLTNINPSLICRAEINGDNAAAAAHGVACAVPATLVNSAALTGKPAYYHQDDKKPFLPADRLHTGKNNIGLFFRAVASKKQLSCVSKDELKLSAPRTADSLANMLFSQNKLKKTTHNTTTKKYIAATVGMIAIAMIGMILNKSAKTQASLKPK